MSITTAILIIDGIEQDISFEYIATVLINHDIAMVKHINFMPYFSKKLIYIRAYVELWDWCESENAKDFIDSLSGSNIKTQFQHHENEYWTIKSTEYDSEFPFNIDGCISEYFPLKFYDSCLDIECAEVRLQKAHRDLVFASEFGDDYDIQVEAEMAYHSALKIFKELRCKIGFKAIGIGGQFITHSDHIKKY